MGERSFPGIICGGLFFLFALFSHAQTTSAPHVSENPEQHIFSESGKINDTPDVSASSPQKSIEELVAQRGKVVGKHALSVGGLTAWLVEAPNKQHIVLYSTHDGQALFAGSVWNAQTGATEAPPFAMQRPLPPVGPGLTELMRPKGGSLLDGIPETGPSPRKMLEDIHHEIAQHRAKEAAYVAKASVPAMGGTFTGEIPESIKTVNTLAGIKEGDADVGDTLYIMFDPRCRYSRKAYQTTRPYIKRGHTIKWIPVMALGGSEKTQKQLAAILQAPEEQRAPLFRKAMVAGLADPPAEDTPSDETLEALYYSHKYLDAVFENAAEKAGVPVGFFLDHRDGKPRMMKGLSESFILDGIFGKPPQP